MKRFPVPLLAFILIFTLTACIPTGLSIESPANLPASGSLATPTSNISTPLPLPPGLTVIDSPSFVFIDFQDAQNGWGIASSDLNPGTSGYLLRSQDGGSTWLDVTPPDVTELGYSTSLAILDTNTIWALVPGEDFLSGMLYHTLDGGASWTSNSVPFGPGSIQFLDTATGRAIVSQGAGAGSNAVAIYQTSDGGLTWTSVFHNDPTQVGSSDSLPLSGIKNGMTFLDADTGWVTGTRPINGEVYLFVTHDGGVSWAMQSIPLPAGYETNQYDPSPPIFFGQDGFLPLMIYLFSGDTNVVFYVTHDGGATWNGDPENASQVVPRGRYSFTDAHTGLSWDGGSVLYYSIDGAQHWSGLAASLNLSDSLNQIDFVSGSTGWALSGPSDDGQASLYHTEDGGVTWTQLIP
jgi:photosystem II stability/assembly factor-like uncharacterized protein